MREYDSIDEFVRHTIQSVSSKEIYMIHKSTNELDIFLLFLLLSFYFDETGGTLFYFLGDMEVTAR